MAESRSAADQLLDQYGARDLLRRILDGDPYIPSSSLLDNGAQAIDTSAFDNSDGATTQDVLADFDAALTVLTDALAAHLADTVAAHAATAISVNSTAITHSASATVQGTLDDLDGAIT